MRVIPGRSSQTCRSPPAFAASSGGMKGSSGRFRLGIGSPGAVAKWTSRAPVATRDRRTFPAPWLHGLPVTAPFELGLDTFGDVTRGADGTLHSHAHVIRDVIAEAELADRLGVTFFGVGEHHRPDFAISAPEVVLAAIAGRTTRIRLGSAVTVLSSDDPVRVFQRFATLDAASNGRAEIIVGRGSFTESFPLFGF